MVQECTENNKKKIFKGTFIKLWRVALKINGLYQYQVYTVES